jgi:predicted MFS family arabinose efflux permease
MVAFNTLGGSVLVVQPVLVSSLIERLNFTMEQAGLAAAADLLGASAAALVCSLMISRIRWRAVLYASIGAVVLADALSGYLTDFRFFGYARIVGGLGEGCMVVVALASIGGTRTPDRLFGLASAGQLGFGALGLWALPEVSRAHGLPGIFLCLTFLVGLSLWLVRYMPQGAPSGPVDAAPAPSWRLSLSSMIGLAAMLSYFVGQGAVWAYLGETGAANGLDPTGIARALALGSGAGLLGALCSSWLDVRYGRIKPIVGALLLTGMSLAMLAGRVELGVFALIAAAFSFAWNFSTTYQLGVLVCVDESARTVALGVPVMLGGLSIGPALAGFIVQRWGFASVCALGISVSTMSAVLFGLVAGLSRAVSSLPKAPH